MRRIKQEALVRLIKKHEDVLLVLRYTDGAKLLDRMRRIKFVVGLGWHCYWGSYLGNRCIEKIPERTALQRLREGVLPCTTYGDCTNWRWRSCFDPRIGNLKDLVRRMFSYDDAEGRTPKRLVCSIYQGPDFKKKIWPRTPARKRK